MNAMRINGRNGFARVVRINNPLLLLVLLPVALLAMAALGVFALGGALLAPVLFARPRSTSGAELSSDGPSTESSRDQRARESKIAASPAIEAEFHRL